ncbi:MAG TPA: transketolase [Opitutaceae bacterium]|jgi:transketolase|nr:transketolase [Opitutaceae bacterium]OQB96389.1 MAG: Transketolase [Verrucomicrobia bacterium ADurb.Bin122]MBP8962347.1 transketolase [Opitutaceae bacterium]HOD47634.1 transketolase [Opitutaceae bacterium]HOR25949.1 transketolase [Opitutaceae bacterium]
MKLQPELLAQAANQARGLAIDAIHKCSSGHLGLPLGAAEIGATLYGYALSHNPAEPRWLNRDRFVLSAGHGSMFLYSWLHLSGYDLPIEEVKNFRQLHSKTPGHPEFHETPGVECTTGPLGQGIANAVGFALAGKMAEARFNTAEHPIFDYHVITLAGDGCMQEGVALEAVAFAGHQQLDNLILIYDSNDITLDAPANKSQSENVTARFKAIGWDVQTLADGHDIVAIAKAINKAKKAKTGRPQLIVAKTIIGKGIAEVQGTSKGHGEGGAKFADAARAGLGLPADQHFFVSEQVKAYFADHKKALVRAYKKWVKTYEAWRVANPEKAALLDSAKKQPLAADILAKIPAFPADSKLATRAAGKDVLQPIAAELPLFVSGSADLYGSTLNYIASDKDCEPANRSGRNIRFGIREHAMAAINNGIAYDGLFRTSCATFLVFADYSRPSMRIAALAKLPVTYIYTHDSIGVGEDGPTHQPVETVSGLRVIPNLDVIRPADPEETAGAFAAAVTRNDGPTLLALSRQVLPMLNEISVQTRREGVQRGAYIAVKETAPLTHILLASGSEVQLAVAAAKVLGPNVRVVSVPCFERFNRQPAEYRAEVLPADCRRRVAIEAGVTGLWHQYVGLDGKVIGIDRFGISAPGGTVFKELGITAEAVVAAAKAL